MKQTSLFGDEPAVPLKSRRGASFDPVQLPVPDKIGPARVRFGTSSWTYPGWAGQVYRDVAAYGGSGRFEKLCLGEYARDPRFRAAGADNLYYAPPAERGALLERFRHQVEGVPGFELCPKVWHGVTVHRYTTLQQRQWHVPPDENPLFLDPSAFIEEVLLPLQEGLGPHLGPLILEVQDNDLAPEAFAQALDRFLAGVRVHSGVRLVVELRTLPHFTPRYLAVLAAHCAAHAYNSWTRMPPIGWQHARAEEAKALGEVTLVRALLRPGQLAEGGAGGPVLRPGRRYEEAVKAFEPYDRIQQVQPDVRSDILRVIEHAPGDVYVLVNNRLEGNAPMTITELQAALWGPGAERSRA